MRIYEAPVFTAGVQRHYVVEGGLYRSAVFRFATPPEIKAYLVAQFRIRLIRRKQYRVGRI